MTRRRFLEALAILALSGTASAEEDTCRIRVSGPAVAETLPLLVMTRPGGMSEMTRTVTFTPWNSPDQLRAMIATAKVDAALMTTASACTLGNKSVPTAVVALFSSPVWLVSTDTSLSSLSGLQGREVLLSFGPGEMPDLLLRALARQAGVQFTPRHVGNALEAVNLVLLGRGDCALLSEPAATLAVSRAGTRTRPGAPIPAKRLDIRDAWREAFPEHPELALGALAMVGPLAADAAARGELRESYFRAAGWVAAHPRQAVSLAREEFPALGSQAVDGVLPGTDIRLVKGPAGEEAARFFLGLLHDMSPASIGGRLPGPEFFEVAA